MPAASFRVSVAVTDDPEFTVLAANVNAEVAAEIAPAVTVTVGSVVVTELEPMVA